LPAVPENSVLVPAAPEDPLVPALPVVPAPPSNPAEPDEPAGPPVVLGERKASGRLHWIDSTTNARAGNTREKRISSFLIIRYLEPGRKGRVVCPKSSGAVLQ
jgi:hypothetical protein